jgi:hypothetical protein
MWTLMKKEFRENWPWCVIGFIAMLYVIRPFFVTDFRGGLVPSSFRYVAPSSFFEPVLPLTNSGFLQALLVFASVYGLALGLLQTLLEERGGTYPFVLAKPVDKTKVVGSKLVVGAVLYLIATGLPFSWAIYWTSVPGHFASPYRFYMSFPGWITIEIGFLYYLGAFLTGVRPARWHGSRLVGLAAVWAGPSALCGLVWYRLFWDRYRLYWTQESAIATLVLGCLLIWAIFTSFHERDF